MSVCVVIPIYKERSELTSYEEVSLKQCFRILGHHSIFFIGPRKLRWEAYIKFSNEYKCHTQIKKFPEIFFTGLGGYSRLLVSRLFYKSFASFQYLLLYQTDAFVFRDDLDSWVEKSYDYVGAPWFEDFSSTNTNAALVGTGNGGFSLRNVEAHLRVLHSFSYVVSPRKNWQNRMQRHPVGLQLLSEFAGVLLDCLHRNNTFYLFNTFKGFEDQFWGLVAPRNFKWFKTAGIEEAKRFSIEMQPRRVFSLNDYQLPFGCHAWWKYDLAFWKPYIEVFGYEL